MQKFHNRSIYTGNQLSTRDTATVSTNKNAVPSLFYMKNLSVFRDSNTDNKIAECLTFALDFP